MRPTVAISDADLIDDLVNEPTVTNVYSGYHPAHYLTPEIPTTATRRMS
jgi:hypothetical protein